MWMTDLCYDYREVRRMTRKTKYMRPNKILKADLLNKSIYHMVPKCRCYSLFLYWHGFFTPYGFENVVSFKI